MDPLSACKVYWLVSLCLKLL